MLTAANQVVPPQIRATAFAFFLMIANLIGTGFGTLLLGRMSDIMTHRYGAEGLRMALLCGLALHWSATIAFAWAVRSIERDWRGDRPDPAASVRSR